VLTLVVCWVAFPLVLLLLSAGCGLLVDEVAGTRLPAPLLLPVGMSAIVAVSSVVVIVPGAATVATPLVAALAAAGLVLSRRRDLDTWPFLAAAGVFLVYGAPVLVSGAATFAGYIKLDDTATFLAITDRVMEHGRSLAGLGPSTYEATLSVNLAHGYPLGSLLPLGVGGKLVWTDVAWLYQPWLSLCAALLALALYELCSPVIRRRWARALVAFVGAQPALLFGYAMWGGVKELAAAALLATAAALVGRLRGPLAARSLVPLAVVCAALIDTLSAGGVIWLLPLLVPLVPAAKRAGSAVVVGAATALLLAVPALVTLTDFLRGANRATFESGSELGNLVRPLRPLQVVGVWPSGDFRLDPSHRAATALLLALGVGAVCAGARAAIERRAIGLLAGLASALTGGVLFVVFGAPWIGGKALAIASPIVLTCALVGCASIASLSGPMRRATLVAGSAGAAALALGVGWSNALAYHDVDLAPRAQLAELEQIGERFGGQGPALMTEYQPYGVRHFLRRLDAEGASELRRRPVFLRGGRVAAKSEYVDVDQIQLRSLLAYRTLVLRRSPTVSRPPSPYRLVWSGRWYDVWEQRPHEAVVAHLPLGGPLDPAAIPRCTSVERLVGLGRPIAPLRGVNLVWPLSSAIHPAGWLPLAGNVVPGGSGKAVLDVEVPKSARYRLWVGGSVRGTIEAAIDGKDVGRVSSQLQNSGQWLDLGSTELAAGGHRITLAVALPALGPGTGGGSFPLGPVALQPESGSPLVSPARPKALCGRTLDWVEALA
jgi:hypothetical protein